MATMLGYLPQGPQFLPFQQQVPNFNDVGNRVSFSKCRNCGYLTPLDFSSIVTAPTNNNTFPNIGNNPYTNVNNAQGMRGGEGRLSVGTNCLGCGKINLNFNDGYSILPDDAPLKFAQDYYKTPTFGAFYGGGGGKEQNMLRESTTQPYKNYVMMQMQSSPTMMDRSSFRATGMNAPPEIWQNLTGFPNMGMIQQPPQQQAQQAQSYLRDSIRQLKEMVQDLKKTTNEYGQMADSKLRDAFEIHSRVSPNLFADSANLAHFARGGLGGGGGTGGPRGLGPGAKKQVTLETVKEAPKPITTYDDDTPSQTSLTTDAGTASETDLASTTADGETTADTEDSGESGPETTAGEESEGAESELEKEEEGSETGAETTEGDETESAATKKKDEKKADKKADKKKDKKKADKKKKDKKGDKKGDKKKDKKGGGGGGSKKDKKGGKKDKKGGKKDKKGGKSKKGKKKKH